MVTLEAIKNEIKKNCPEGIYLLVGDDSYLIKTYADKICKTVVGDNADFDFVSMGPDAFYGNIEEEIMQFSFLGNRKVVSVSNLDIDGMSAADFKEFLSMLNKLGTDNLLLLYYDNSDIDYKKSSRFNSLIKQLEQTNIAVVAEINHKSGAELAAMLIKGAEKRNCTLNRQTADFLISYCSEDLQILLNELNKLCLYKLSGEITEEDIKTICSETLESSIYKISKLILSKNAESALLEIRKLLDMKIPAAVISNEIASSFLDIYYAAVGEKAHKTVSETAKDFGIPKSREFRIKNAAYYSRKISEKTLNKLINTIILSDAKLKGNDANNELIILTVNLISILSSHE